MQHRWLLAYLVATALFCGAPTTGLAAECLGGTQIMVVMHDHCCQPPPRFDAICAFDLGVDPHLHGLVPLDDQALDRTLKAAHFANDDKNGARTVIFANLQHLTSSQKRAKKYYSLEAADRLVNLGVYPGSIRIFWTKIPDHVFPATNIVVEVGKIDGKFIDSGK